jgi:hypothetical protein
MLYYLEVCENGVDSTLVVPIVLKVMLNTVLSRS